MNNTIISSILIISMIGLMTSQNNVYGGAPDFEKHYLTETDAYLNNLVDKCSKETDSYLKSYCTNLIEDAWWYDCSLDYDKLDTCKNGKIENFLKNEGIPT